MTAEPQVAPFGAWESPITAATLVTGAVGISEVCADGDDVWWAESRPEEGGRSAVMRHSGGVTAEITPGDAYVRTLVHEYGGAAWWADRGVLYYVDLSDQRLRKLVPGGEPLLLTPEPQTPRGLRYADGRVSPDGRWFVCVRERHPGSEADAGHEPVNEIVAVATDGSGAVSTLWQGSDFVSSPRISPDGSKLAWITWDHPDMPWDSTVLRVHGLGDGRLGDELAAVGNGDEAWAEPDWTPDGRLWACSDRNEWWNLYEISLGAAGSGTAEDGDAGDTGEAGRAEATITEVVGGPFEIATPAWVFGMQRWARSGGSAVAVAALATGDEILIDGATFATVDTSIASLRACPGGVVYAGSGFGSETEVVRLRFGERGIERQVISSGRDLPVPTGLLIEPEAITFPTGPPEPSGPPDEATGSSGRPGSPGAGPAVGSEAPAAQAPVAHGLYYPPTNPAYCGPPGERPPLLVLAHGGPTAAARRMLQLGILYWTSRGFGVVDVDYRGSTGYGRSYRRALQGAWGVADTEDCVAAARFLVARGDADADRLAIRGGSAGGFTVLSALAFHDVFAVGASRYGVADLEALAADTHKFESRYLDSLIGPWPADKAVYEQRSPINHLDGFSAPMIVLQGDSDAIVPPNQSEMIVAALQERSVPVCYICFEGEQHGFRKAESVIAALEAELAFFGEILGFEPAGGLPAIEIRR